MVVWGGHDNPGDYETGGTYDPVANTWTATGTTNAPMRRQGHVGVWTGDRLIVWGGLFTGSINTQYYLDTGGRYDVLTKTWTPTSTSSGGGPEAAQGKACWTGSRMLVWGGTLTGDPAEPGGQYDPATDSWTAMSTLGAPTSNRVYHTVVWTGSKAIFWGGRQLLQGGVYQNNGGLYDPVSDTWSSTSLVGAPSGRESHTAVWTGSRMIVWGGYGGAELDTGGEYAPVTDSWTPTPTAGAPAARHFHTAVWTGSLMIVWGGGDFGSSLKTGARYNASTHVWTPTSVDDVVPRTRHVAVWTGSRMLTWGGQTNSALNADRYDPVSDDWSQTSGVGGPTSTYDAVGVWTGEEMIVWGGRPVQQTSQFVNSGGRYNPHSNQWTPVSTVDAPAARAEHTGAWAGNALLVWGGYDRLYNNTFSAHYMASGGRYVALQKFVDDDGDGFSDNAGDCNDSEASVYPGAIEVCDGLDNDCNQATDDIDLSESVSIETAARSLEGNTVLYLQDPNPPVQVTGYDIYRSADASLPIGTWPLQASNVQDADGGTAGVQCVDDSGDVSPTDIWFYDVTAFNAECSAEGPH
jgi:hypothetical protein